MVYSPPSSQATDYQPFIQPTPVNKKNNIKIEPEINII